MTDRIDKLVSHCSKIGFGDVTLSGDQQTFCNEMNTEMISLCKSMPVSTQNEAFLFIMKYLRASIDNKFNLFKYFYAPAWSIIYWLIKAFPKERALSERDLCDAKTTHCMAMLLHPLDDHLNDNDLQATHLVLLLRSQAWLIMINAVHRLAGTVENGPEIVRDLIDRYYSGVCGPRVTDSLDSYCAMFRKEMATWLIVPALLMKKMGITDEAGEAILSGYESFGIAWRLLDDINDIEADIENGALSSVYCALSEDGRRMWLKHSTADNLSSERDILEVVYETGVIDVVRERICRELDSAASVTDSGRFAIEGLAGEYRFLMRPLKRT
jgi:hypothetical protein